MKRLFILLIVIPLVLILLVWQAPVAQAEQITSELQEKIMATSGSEAKLEVTWKGKLGPEGTIVLPQPALKAKWLQTEATGAAIEEPNPKEVKYGGNKWYQWNVTGNNEGKEISLRVIYLVPDLFKETKSEASAEGGPTARGDLRNFTYNFKNNTPFGIGKYTFSVVLPPGYEVFNVTSPKKDFKVTRDKNSGSIIVDMSGKKDTPAIPTGSSVSLEFNYVKGLSVARTVVFWVASVFIAGAFLYFRRHLVLSIR
ncbi:hypothetical protein MGLY_33090 [Neomoorella glycerini]|uniref:Uncharacterized protein n=1 Tax=Neomoorella glycerini TaxID=55779 RepID=A0A6I5ZVQ4_9FIRM|nr:hypothetical protein [Moorella glycerini]QGP93886.1 hypothetical protein MGLY_33090 [Moorella glycerini]